MKKYYLLILIFCKLSSVYAQTAIVTVDFNTMFKINGNASILATDKVQLTPNLTGQSGSAFSKIQVDFAYDFSLTQTMYFGNNDAGADGMGFTLHNDPRKENTIGGAGGSIGLDGIANSICYKFDTYVNSPEPSCDFVVFGYGAGPTYGTSTCLSNIEDNVNHTFVINWVAATKVLTLTVDGTLRDTQTLSNIASLLGGTTRAYFGFTGATGGSTNTQQTQISIINGNFPPILNLDVNGSTRSLAPNDYFSQGIINTALNICDTDAQALSFTNFGIGQRISARITIPNVLASESFTIGTLPGGVTVSNTNVSGNQVLLLSNIASLADVVTALRAVTYKITSSTDLASLNYQRSLTISLTDNFGASDSKNSTYDFQSPGGVPDVALWLKADAGTQDVVYKNVASGSRTASSNFSGLAPANSTLASPSSWSAATAVTGDYLTLDLGSSQSVTGLSTKGRGDAAQWVTKYTISYSIDNLTYTPVGVTFNANSDQNTEVFNFFPVAITARYFRIIETAFSGHPSLRADLITTATNTANGASLTVWADQSSKLNTVSQSITANKPTFSNSLTDLVNFNPTVKFNGSNQVLTNPLGVFKANTFSSASMFVMTKTNVVQNSNLIFTENLGTGVSTNFYAPYSDSNVYWDGANNSRINTLWGGTVGIPYLWTGFNNQAATPTNRKELRRDGLVLTSNATAPASYAGNNSSMSIGSTYNGNINEVIIYNTELTAIQRQQIESYLAIKYGKTLDQTVATNYLASDGSTIVWNATTNTGYNNAIFGLGRDDGSSLHQRISTSVNTGEVVTISSNSNFTTSNTTSNHTDIANDKYFLVAGHNGLTTGYVTFASTNAAINSKMLRVWKVQETGTNQGVINIKVNETNATYIIVSPDATFGDGNDTYTALTSSTVALDLANGQFFTFGANLQSPGGVNANLISWYRGENASNTTTSWKEQNTTNNATGTATLNSSGADLLNYNPSYTFNGTTDLLTLPSALDLGGAANSTYSFIGVAKQKGTDNQRLFGSAIGNVLWGYYANLENAIYLDGTPSYITSGANGVIASTTNLNLFSLTRTSGGVVNQRKNGTLVNTSATSAASTMRGTIGGSSGENSACIVGEYISYNTDQTTNINQIESYLALKYGLSMTTNYVSTAGTIFWNATTNSGYVNDVFGIGRDDSTLLHQRISTSATSGLVTFSSNANFTTSNTTANHTDIANDKYFLITGNNGLTTQYNSFTSTSAAVNSRMNRIWKVQETGTDQGVINIKTSDPTATYIVVSPDTTFGDANDVYTALTSGAVALNLANGQYFTFAAYLSYPGGVSNGIAVWYKANSISSATADNAVVASITDSSGQLMTGTTFNSPTYRTGNSAVGLNFNPVLSFNGTNQYIQAPSGFANFTAGISMFSAHQFTNTNSWARIMDFGNGAPSDNLIFSRNATNNYYGLQTYNTGSQALINSTANSVYTNSYGLVNWNQAAGVAGTNVSSSLYLKGVNNLTGSLVVPNNVVRTINYIGRSNWGADAYFAGYVPEFILYNRTLTAPEQLQVNSYLALKYGFTLGTTVAPLDYKLSDGTTVWTANTTYQYNVIGIGKDSLSGLEQQISKSSETIADIITISTDNNYTNSNSSHSAIANDKYFLLIGNNNASTNFATYSGGSNATTIMSRIWRTQETGTDQGNVYIKANTNKAQFLVISNDATFTDSDTWIQMSFGMTAVNFSNGQYFTFASNVIGPGGVASNLSLWNQGDSGVSYSGTNVTAWVDQTATNTFTINGSPQFNSLGINFNPSIALNGSSYFTGNTSITNFTDCFSVAKIQNPSGLSISGAVLGTTAVVGGNYFFHTEGGTLYFGSPFGGTNVFGNNISWSIMNGDLSETPAASQKIKINGIEYPNSVGGDSILHSGIPQIGARGSEGLLSGSEIAEVILYNSSKGTGTERSRIQSYLAVKYGLTLGNNANPVSYLASDASTIWTGSTTYQNNIIGLARDNASGLEQQISFSQSTSTDILTLSTDNNFALADGFHTPVTANKSFLMIGSDNASTSIQGAELDLVLYTGRVGREWKVQNTNFSQTVNLKFTGFGSTTLKTYYLIKKNGSSDFTSGATNVGTLDANGSITGVTLSNGDYFTIALNQSAPGGVVEGVLLWLRPEEASTPQTWTDYSGNGNNVTTLKGGTTAPAFVANSVNFNGGVSFNQQGLEGSFVTAFSSSETSSYIFGSSSGVTSNARMFGVAGSAQNDFDNAQSAILFYSASANTYLSTYRSSAEYSKSANVTGVANYKTVPYLFSTHFSANQNLFYTNGNTANTTTFTNTTFNANKFDVGTSRQDVANERLQGSINEVILFSKSLTASERNRVDSYLALKYGVTLGSTTNLVNYTASDNVTTFWTGNATYQNAVFGIGRDDNSGINQRISTPIYNADIVKMSTDSNLTNVNSTHTAVNTDKVFLMLGNNNASTAITTASVPSGYTKRIARQWLVQNTGFTQTVNLQFNGFGSFIGRTWYLIKRNGNSDLSSGVTQVIALDANGKTTSSVSLSNNDYLTLAAVEVDTDGDGYANLDDLDDDNDGILDITECEATNLLTNGIFNGNASGWTVASPWTYSLNFIASYNDGTGDLSQSVNLSNALLDSNGNYNLQFDLALGNVNNDLNTTGSGTINVYLGGVKFVAIVNPPTSGATSGTITSSNGAVLTPSTNPSITTSPTSNFAHYSLAIPSAGIPLSTTLTFSAVSISGDDFYFDNISIASILNCDSDNDTIPNTLDLDSDQDGCTDANEYYNSATTSGTDGGMYGTGIPAVNSNGKVIAASYSGTYTNVITVGSASTISTQPIDQSTTVGGNVTFIVTATGGSGTRQYQWQVSTDGTTWNNVTNGGVYSGTTTTALTITGATVGMNGYLYKTIITQSDYICGNVVTNSGKLCVIDAPTVGTITQPTCAVTTGSVILSGLPSTGTWTINPGGITGIGASTTISSLAAGTYNFTVTNASGCTSSASTDVVINSIVYTVAGTVSSAQTICSGTTPSDLTLTGNTGNVVKWQKSTDSAFTTPDDIVSTSTTLTGTIIGSLTTTTYFRAVVQNGSCTVAYTDPVEILLKSTTWNGTAWSDGAPDISTTAFMTGNYTSSGDLFACSLTVSNNAVVNIQSGHDVTLYGKLTVDTGSTFNMANNSNLLQQTNVSNTGIINISRNTLPIFRLDYNLWSSPVTGSQTLVNFSPLTSNVSPGNIRFYTFNTSTSYFDSVATASTTTFAPAKGYLIRMPNNWMPCPITAPVDGDYATGQSWTGTFTGTPRNGDVSFTMVNSGGDYVYNATGNPYPSSLSVDSFIDGNSTAIEGTLWFWRKLNNTQNPISYSTLTKAGMTLNNNALYTDEDYVSVGQGFFVKALTGQTNLNYTNAMRSSANANQFLRSNSQKDRFWLKLTNSSNVSFGTNLIAYLPNTTIGYDSGYDGLFMHDSQTSIYTVTENKDLVIQARSSFSNSDVFPLCFKTNTANTYTITLQQVEGLFQAGQVVYLRDNLIGVVHNLSESAYTFASEVGTFATRFDVLYQNSLSNNQIEFSENNVVVYKNDNFIHINTGNKTMNKVRVFDIRGRLIIEKDKVNATELSIDSSGIPNQVLLIQVSSKDGVVVTKKIIN